MDSGEPQPSRPVMDEQYYSDRQHVATQYEIIVLKSRLMFGIYCHCFMFFGMVTKLVPRILEKLDVYIPEIQDLEVPEPDLWEWIWLSSLFASFFGWDAVKNNTLSSLRFYMIGIAILGYLPLVSGMFLWFFDVWIYLFSDDYFDLMDIVYWMDYPYGLLWYAFILVALQVHSYSLYFGYNLMTAWKTRDTYRAD